MQKSKKLFWSLGIVALICIILRSILIINNTDIRGLYINSDLKLLLTLRIVLVISTLIFLIVPLFDKFVEENRSRNKNKLLGISMAIFGGIIMFVGLVEFFMLVQLIGTLNWGEFKFFLLNTPNSMMKLITSFMAFITGWLMTTLSIKILNKKPVDNNYSLGVMLVVWAVTRAMLFTKVNNTVVTIDDNLFSIITIIFSISFFFGFSRILFNVDCKAGYKMAISSGMVVILYGLLVTIPNYVAFFMGKNTFFSIKDINGITNLAITIFAIIFLSIIMFSKGENKFLFTEQKNHDESIEQSVVEDN